MKENFFFFNLSLQDKNMLNARLTCLNPVHRRTYKAGDGIQLYDTAWFSCRLLADDVEHLSNVFLE